MQKQAQEKERSGVNISKGPTIGSLPDLGI